MPFRYLQNRQKKREQSQFAQLSLATEYPQVLTLYHLLVWRFNQFDDFLRFQAACMLPAEN